MLPSGVFMRKMVPQHLTGFWVQSSLRAGIANSVEQLLWVMGKLDQQYDALKLSQHRSCQQCALSTCVSVQGHSRAGAVCLFGASVLQRGLSSHCGVRHHQCRVLSEGQALGVRAAEERQWRNR